MFAPVESNASGKVKSMKYSSIVLPSGKSSPLNSGNLSLKSPSIVIVFPILSNKPIVLLVVALQAPA